MSLSSPIAGAQSLSFHPKSFHGGRRPAPFSSRFRASADIPDFLSPDWLESLPKRPFGPRLNFSAEEAISCQLDALKYNDQPHQDYGIEVMYRFAGFDPFERSTYFGPHFDLGQFERFRRIFHHSSYRVLLGHKERKILSSLWVKENRFKQRVWVQGTRPTEEEIFEFTMVQRLGGCWDGYWLTESLHHDGDSFSGERFVVLSYNILADYLANNHRALYWHIPRRFMSWDWRKRSILFELGLWSADIMCFQEVDKFHELEEDLKRRGYSSIWKMRTGEPIDGCAIFWRACRFKLVYDECIEFYKHGMRDNVAQVCVLESLVQNQTDEKSALSESSEGPNRVVVCNIHVLYNPRRGEIKLGQVRVLLERAQAVSKKWDDAPVVLCGDFNCVPKSPLYDFISEQKLDISGIDRDKVSGQATAEIHPAPRQFGRRDKGPSAGNMANVASSQNNSVDRKQYDGPEKHNSSESLPKTNSQSQFQLDESAWGVSDKLFDGSLNSSICSQELPVKSSHNSVGFTEDGGSHNELNTDSEEEDRRHSCNSNNSLSSNLCSVSCSESIEVDISGMPSDLGGAIANHAQTSVDKPNEKNASSTFKNLDEKLAGLSLGEIDETLEDTADLGEDAEKLSELSDEGDAFPSNLDEAVLEDLLSSTPESEAVDVCEPAYDPSQWTPMEIATATGNSNNTVLEHSLKLRSTYTEVEDRSGTRDPIGEPLVTSYNSHFMGTVDYIWRSEGLCTVKALAPIPKNTMQASGGFPTKKWGSDHIALATELAFTK